MPYIAKPDNCFLNQLTKYRVDGGIQIYKGNGKYYTWDRLHGEIEVYNKRGQHLMVLDPEGNYIKDAVEGRSINV